MDTPLHLDEYFFPHVIVSADPEVQDQKEFVETNYNVSVNVLEIEKESSRYQLAISIVSCAPENEQKRIPYKIELVVIGLFQVSKNWPEPEKLLEINGSTILYAAAREFIITITSRGPWGAAILPTTSFLVLYNKKRNIDIKTETDKSTQKSVNKTKKHKRTPGNNSK